LLRSDRSISERTLQVIGEAKAKGVRVTIATGRMFVTSVQYAKEIGVDIPFVVSQGAMIRTIDGDIVTHKPLPPEMARQVVGYGLEHNHQVNVYVNDRLFVQRAGNIIRDYLSKYPYSCTVCDLLELLEDVAPTKVLFLEDPETMPALRADLDRRFGGMVHMALSDPGFLEINKKNVTKWESLKEIGGYYGIEGDEIMAIGDSLNDLEMVRDAGWGVAMGNAMDEVKQSARLLTETNDQDGVAHASERWVLNR
jgi:Cof subfamily protein (haloacid dehalogenase superfamily)